VQDRQPSQPQQQPQPQQGAGDCWVRVSDSSVAVVDVDDVLGCHATLLVYESAS
jgi:hypothetical protein